MAVGGGTGANPRGSGIIKEYIQYSSSSTPSAVYTDIAETQCVIFDLSTKPDALPNISTLANNSDYYLHYGVQDKALNSSAFFRVDFKIDNDDPTIVKKLNAGGFTKYAQNYLYVIEEVTDATSGVVYYTHGSTNSKVTLSTNYVNPSTYTINQSVDIGSTPGTVTVSVKSYDQAENFVDNSFNITRSSQTINWISLSGSRSVQSPFKVDGYYKAEITPTSPDLISGFYPTANLYYAPLTTDFDTTVGSQAVSDQNFSMIVPDTNVDMATMYLITDGNPPSFAAKQFTFSALDYSTMSATNPTNLTIIEQDSRSYTNTVENYYKVTALAGDITISGTTTTNGDLIIGYKITESSSSPGAPPQFNATTNNYEDTASVGWNVFPKGVMSIDSTDPYSFSPTSFGSKTVYLWVATMAYNGTYSSVGAAQTFSANMQISYINDFEGPTASNVRVKDSSNVNEICTVTGTAPNQTFTRPSEVTADDITITGTLTDNMTNVERWVITNFGREPAYTPTNPGIWNVRSSPSASYNFSQTVKLNRPNSPKTIYIWAVDSVGNLSKNKVKVTLNNPAYNVPTYGTANGFVYKFEGKTNEHPLRETIASMFGDGVFHTGFISSKTAEVIKNRVHKLSEYRGLRVINRSNNDANENLPAANNPLKFSDFLGKVPRISDLRIQPVSAPLSAPVNMNIPQYEGDIRDIVLTLDIDTGNVPTSHVAQNDNIIDDKVTWYIDFIPEGGGPIQNKTFTYDPSRGIITNFNFANAGVYIVLGFSSFGFSISATYRIFKQGTILPPVQGPPITVPVPIGNPGGTTLFTIDFFVDQVSLAVDAALCIDRSGSYVPGFSNAMYNTLSQSLDAIAEFSKNTSTNTTDARYSVVWFWNPGSSGIETAQDWTSDKSLIDTAVAKYKDNGAGGWEPKIEAVARIANSDIVGSWREGALRMILLYSDEPDGPPTNRSTGSSASTYTNSSSANYFIKLLIDNEIAFLVFDAGKDYGGGPTIDKDNLRKAVADTANFGSAIETLGLGASSSDIVNAITSVFTKYKSTLTFDIEPEDSTPAIFYSKSANSAHPAGTSVPMLYNDLISVGNRKKAVFDVLLDNDEVYNLGTNTISTFVKIRNSSGIVIAYKEIILTLTP